VKTKTTVTLLLFSSLPASGAVPARSGLEAGSRIGAARLVASDHFQFVGIRTSEGLFKLVKPALRTFLPYAVHSRLALANVFLPEVPERSALQGRQPISSSVMVGFEFALPALFPQHLFPVPIPM
jgi:hypothetical protein